MITDSTGKARYVLSGTWDDKLEGARVLNTVETSKGKIIYETGETKVLWQRRYPPYVITYPYTLEWLISVQISTVHHHKSLHPRLLNIDAYIHYDNTCYYPRWLMANIG